MHKKKIFAISLMILGLFVLIACGAAEPQPTVGGPTPTLADEKDNTLLQTAPTSTAAVENNAVDSPQVTATAVPPDTIDLEESYPPAPQITATTRPEGYPAPPEPPPTVNPYPGGLVWILHPLGVQCEEGPRPGYADIDQAQETLQANGVPVIAMEITDLLVTTQCGAPTSTHYRAQIAAENLTTAVAMSWQPES